MENPRNQDGIGAKELLVVSVGTGRGETRRKTLCAIEADMEQAFPDFSVRRGFTSDRILRLAAQRDGIFMDSVEQALERALANGVQMLAVQPTLLMDGLENNRLKATVERYAPGFQSVAIGKPLLSEEADFRKVAAAITRDTAGYDDGQTAVCFMGHGTSNSANGVYTKLQSVLRSTGHANCFIGTVKSAPTLYDVLAEVEKGGFRKVVLQPLMIVAGSHTLKDMAGSGEDSWLSVFTQAGYDVTCVSRGLGELPAIRRILAEHAREAAASLR